MCNVFVCGGGVRCVCVGGGGGGVKKAECYK